MEVAAGIRGILATPNFGFLAKQDPNLVQLGALAERYFRDDPSACLFKLRQFAELLAKLIAAHHGLYEGEREKFEDILRRLSLDRILPRETADVFHRLRKLGNVAAHEGRRKPRRCTGRVETGTATSAFGFFRTYAKQSTFKPGPFRPPPEPVDATASLQAEIEALQRKVDEARREAEGHSRARESAEHQLQREAADRAIWEQLAQEYEDRLRRVETEQPRYLPLDPDRQSLKRPETSIRSPVREPALQAIAAGRLPCKRPPCRLPRPRGVGFPCVWAWRRRSTSRPGRSGDAPAHRSAASRTRMGGGHPGSTLF